MFVCYLGQMGSIGVTDLNFPKILLEICRVFLILPPCDGFCAVEQIQSKSPFWRHTDTGTKETDIIEAYIQTPTMDCLQIGLKSFATKRLEKQGKIWEFKSGLIRSTLTTCFNATWTHIVDSEFVSSAFHWHFFISCVRNLWGCVRNLWLAKSAQIFCIKQYINSYLYAIVTKFMYYEKYV